jgi:hypothetical protein
MGLGSGRQGMQQERYDGQGPREDGKPRDVSCELLQLYSDGGWQDFGYQAMISELHEPRTSNHARSADCV